MTDSFEIIQHGSEYTVPASWKESVSLSLNILREITGRTEDEFLRIGERLQEFFQRALQVTTMANELVALVSGEEMQHLTERLHLMTSETGDYLSVAQRRGQECGATMAGISRHLEELSAPLEGFRKMTKSLRMLGISTKIESSRIGEMGSGFLTLAQDVERLSMVVSQKSEAILGHRQLLSSLIQDNVRTVRDIEAGQGRELQRSIAEISHSIGDLVALNDRCRSFGVLVSSVSGEVSEAIGNVVMSLQMHDMTRQQMEHVIEALERLNGRLPDAGADVARDAARMLVVETGDLCELQSAQLRHASSEFCLAVQEVMERLHEIADKQSGMVGEARNMTGATDAGDNSAIGAISGGMQAVAAVLKKSAASDREMSETLNRVADTMGEVRTFVGDIDEIGVEIDLIALNSQIKAARTGTEGAALGVLAEAIKRLSVDAIARTESITGTLADITAATEHLLREADKQSEQLAARTLAMEGDLSQVLSALASDNAGVMRLLVALSEEVGLLNHEIGAVVAGIDVHDRVGAMVGDVLTSLDRIDAAARAMEPATTEFVNNLRFMEERYTMESERHIHEAIARKRGVKPAPHQPAAQQPQSADSSEFGDNVDLF